MASNKAFGRALRRVRTGRNMSQEDFEGVATRAYVSELERGLKSPTLNMIESLAASMNVQPLTLMLATYAAKHPQASPEALMQQALEELKSLP